MSLSLRSRHDRDIVRLALPALGALAAEPLYVLVDTAVVGHLGRSELAALGLASVVLSGVFSIFNFLQYGTTAHVARATGAGQERAARQLGGQALWLSVVLGAVVAAATAVASRPVVEAMGGEGETAEHALTYLRIMTLGLPFAFLALGASGYLRGLADLRTPLLVVVWANVANVVIELLFVYGFGWGIAGSAWGTVLAQAGMGVAFVVVVRRSVAGGDVRPRWLLARRLLTLGRHIFVRTSALMASFVLAGAVAARFGDASLAAHQVAFQLWIFLALVLDSIAIAGQIIVGRALGAGTADDAWEASTRMVWLSVATGAVFAAVLLALVDVLPRAFTGDDAVLAACAALWPLFALMQPLNGAVFALDGILIGAGDGRYLMWSMLASLACCAVALALALELGWGIRGVWAALVVLIVVRLATLGVRFRGRRWAVTGWAA